MTEITLTKGFKAVIDSEDLVKVKDFKWVAFVRDAKKNKIYARAHIKGSGRNGKQISLHRLIMDAPKGMVVDHIDGDTLNNKKGNLRVCLQAENARNSCSAYGSSRFKGVTLRKKINRWRAYIKKNYRQIHLGWFASEAEAAKAYNIAALKLFGSFAKLNKI